MSYCMKAERVDVGAGHHVLRKVSSPSNTLRGTIRFAGRERRVTRKLVGRDKQTDLNVYTTWTLR